MKEFISNTESELQDASQRESASGQMEYVPHAQLFRRLRLLWDHRRFLFRATLAGLLVTAVIAFLIPKQYESTTRLMPPDTNSNSGLAIMAALTGQMRGLAPLADNVLGGKSSGALFVGVLRSRTVQDRLIDHFDLKKVYRARLTEDARRRLADHTSVYEDFKSGIITITVTDHSPQRAAALARGYVQELDWVISHVSTSAAHRERVFLEERLKAVKKDLDEAAAQFGQFASKNTAIDIKEQGRAMLEAAAALQGQLIAAQAQLEGLKQIYTDNNVRVREVSARISELRRELGKLGGTDSTATGAAAQSGRLSVPSIRELPLLGITYADLYRRTKIQEAVYETLTQQYEMAKVQEAKETPSVKLLDAALVPEKKSFPPRLIMILLGGLLAAICSSVYLLARARWQEIDCGHPGKVLAYELADSVRATAGKLPWNRMRLRAVSSRLRMKRRSQPLDEGGLPGALRADDDR